MSDLGDGGNIEINLDDFNKTEESEQTSNPFLNGVDEQDRAVVGKYIDEWDAGVTKKMQEVHKQYEPFKDIEASPEQLAQALNMYKMAEADPLKFYSQIKGLLVELDMLEEEENNEPPVGTSNLPEYDGVPENLVTDLQSMRKEIEELREFKQSTTTEKQNAQQQQQLDELLSGLHNEHGDFDDDAILGRILRGQEPEAAVKDYQESFEKIVNSRNKRPVPPTIGSGATPIEQVDSSKLSNPKDRKKVVADILSNIGD